MKRKNVLVYTALPVNNLTTVLHNNICDIIKLVSQHADVTLLYKAKKIRKYYENRIQIDNLKYVRAEPLTDTKNDFVFKHSTKYLDDLDDHYDVFFTYSLLANTASGMKKTVKQLHEKDQFRVTFMSTLMHIVPVIVVDDVLKKYKGIHMCCTIVDYNEPDIRPVWPDEDIDIVSWYSDAKNNYKKLSIAEYANFKDGFQDAPKTQEFVFGYALTFKGRRYLSDFVQKNVVESDQYKLYVKDNDWYGSKRDDLIPHDEYNKELAKSKYTLLAPSTIMTEFSFGRFNEAIVRKCLPIFLDNVQYHTAFGNDEQMCNFIKDNLTFTSEYKSIEDFIQKHDYEKLVKEIYQLDFMKKHLDKDKYADTLLKEIGLKA